MTIKMKNNYAEHFNPVHWCEHQYLAFFILLSTSCIDAAIFYSLFEDISYDTGISCQKTKILTLKRRRNRT